MDRRNLVKGFAAATAAPIALAGLLTIIFVIFSPSPIFAIFGFLPGAIALASSISIVVVLIFGIPAHWLLNRLKLTSLGAYLAAGLLIALIPFTLLAWDYQLGVNYVGGKFGYVFLALLIVSGPLAAFSFWYVVRPDWFSQEIATKSMEISSQDENSSNRAK